MRKALLVIDIQSKTIGSLYGKKKFLRRVNRMIDFFHEKNIPVIFIKQDGCGELSNNLNLLDNDVVVDKKEGNAFTSSQFNEVVNNLKLDSFVVTGLMSNACIQKTCKGALKQGYSVTLVEDAHDSIVKPLKTIWNKRLKKIGVNTLTSSMYITIQK
ncbi:isochorismatase family protein [Candidatus Enterococcus lemimoniae]|uniref:Isochorismatase-like domain-containing protein n=1 Tax=Candidatus Enterococcus lemimoniae TaxID=1834167 RepID=A0ABZ2T0T7_9ENTE